MKQWLIALTVCLYTHGVVAATDDGDAAGPSGKVERNAPFVELFTSHGCSSCPPAETLFGTLLQENPDLVALEFHVDYWNELVHGSDGNWVDPFSSKAYTDRQRQYDSGSLDGRRGVYTPQMVINGRYAAVGSDSRRIRHHLDTAGGPSQVSMQVERTAESVLQVNVENPDAHSAGIWLAIFIRRADTMITAGENRHLTVTNHHVVTSLKRIADLTPGSNTVEISAILPSEQGCAILVQQDLTGPVLGAANCPN